ncbi:MAG: xanthine dehydrogenase family protein molybdopterin-binding subunit [Alphaproteobacteria bacterium]|nr:xanthine dehydrogenase family protein molybdopterin-binding subunit [Alphaproteobacteria bacterium]
MAKFGISQPVRRVEDNRLITGDGRYLDDVKLARMTAAVMVRSPHAHARIKSVKTDAARKVAGVLLILTAKDVEAAGVATHACLIPMTNRDGSKRADPQHPVLASDVAKHVGDSIAMVVAETVDQAKDAAELIEIDYEVLPSVSDLGATLDAKAPLAWPELGSNLCFDWETGDKAATDTAFANAVHKVTVKLVNNRIVVNSMEPRGAIGEFNKADGRYTLHCSTQGSHLHQKLIAKQIGIDKAQLRVITPDVGGGFGMKIFMYSEYPLVLLAAKAIGRPVKWAGDRSDAFLSDTQGRDNLTVAELALDKDGRFLALRHTTIANMGAYLSTFAPFIPTTAGTRILPTVYTAPAVYAQVKGVFTNTTPVDAYRGAGRPENVYLVERLVDLAAVETGLGRDEIRRRNLIPTTAMPYKTPLGQVIDSGDFLLNMEEALKKADWAGFATRRAEAAKRGKLRGIGLAYYMEVCSGGDPEDTEIRFEPSGDVTVLIGTQSNGQGHQTAYAQIIADRLGVPFESIRVVQGDTDIVATGNGTGGSRSIPTGGSAVLRAAEAVLEKAKGLAAHRLEAAPRDLEFFDGTFRIVGTDRRIGLVELAKVARDKSALPEGMEPGLDQKADFQPPAQTFPNGCHVCEIEIDRETCEIDIVRFVAVDDFGRLLNPMMAGGQVHGGVAQGVGQALLEHSIYDPASGQLITGSFMDYAMPRADNLSAIEFNYNEFPCTTNPLGAKGAGEAGCLGSPPAVIGAICDALKDYGVTHIDMPATPQAIWRAMNGGRKKAAD